MTQITIAQVRRAVNLSTFEYNDPHMAPKPRGMLEQNKGIPPKEAGVLALIYPDRNELHITLTRRTEDLRGHSGQVSFPGGRRDPDDDSFVRTALRETCEELDICDEIDVVGQLTPFYIPPSHYNVYPCVGVVAHKPHFRPNPAEVAQVFGFRLADLIDDSFKGYEHRMFNGIRVEIPFYTVDEHKVWGATAAMLGELEQRLRQVVNL